MKLNIGSIIKKTYFFFLLCFLLNIIYRDQLVNNGELFQKYLVLYILSFVLFLVFFLSESLKIKFIIILFSTYISLVICEISLYSFEKFNKKKFDFRSKYEIYNELSKTSNVTVTMPPTTFVFENDKKVFPIGGISNSLTINCNENGYWATYNSDRHGFNNPNSVWEKDIDYLLIGDSFLHGSCVNENETISSKLRNNTQNNIVNLGYGSNGLPNYFITLREIIHYKKIKNVIIFLYLGNDLTEKSFSLFLNDKFFKKYINDESFTQKIFLNQKEVDKKLKKKVQVELSEISKNQKKTDKTKRSEISKIFTLYNLRILTKSKFKQPKKKLKDNYIYFEEYIKKIRDFVESNQINFYIVILPDYDLLLEQKNNSHTRYEKVNEILRNNNIESLDIYEKVFLLYKKPYKKFFSSMNSHYNAKGYNLIANEITNYLFEK